MTHRSQSGFSLVEMLAALAILSMAGLALMNAVTASGRSAIIAHERALAGLAAQNLMNTAILEAHPLRGIEDSRGVYTLAGIEYEWTIAVEPTPDPALRRVTLVVSDDRGPAAELTSFTRAGS